MVCHSETGADLPINIQIAHLVCSDTAFFRGCLNYLEGGYYFNCYELVFHITLSPIIMNSPRFSSQSAGVFFSGNNVWQSDILNRAVLH